MVRIAMRFAVIVLAFVAISAGAEEGTDTARAGATDTAKSESTTAKTKVSNIDDALVVKKISFRGTERESEDFLSSLIQTKVGAEISSDLLSKDVKSLYKNTGFFSDVQVGYERLKEGGMEVVYLLKESPKIQSFRVIGNEKVKYGKLKKGITLKPSEIYSDKQRWESERNILKTYKQKGYYLATVKTHTDIEPDANTITVTFEVSEGQRIKIENINFIGNDNVSAKSLSKQIKTRMGKHFDEALFDQDMTALRYYYQDRGYAQVKVHGYEKHLTDDKTGLMLDVTVDEGPQYIIESYTVNIQQSGKPAFSEQKIRKMLDPAEGEIFDLGTFQKSIDKIKQGYQDKGYLMAEIIPTRKFDEENATVHLTLNINERDVLIINQVRINGLEKTKEHVIRRELDHLGIKTDELLDARALRKARQRFFQMGSFVRDVQFQTTAVEGNHQDISVSIVETPRTGMFSLGGGYGTEGGIFGVAEVGENNLFGRAYRVHLKGELGRHDRHNAELRFNTPWVFGTPTRFSASLYNTKRIRRYYGQIFRDRGYDRYVYERRGASVTVGRPIAHDVDVSVRLRNERVHATRSGYTEELDDELVNRSTRSITWLLARDTRDYRKSIYDPMAGSYNTVSYEYSGGLLGADNEFQKYSVDTSWFWSPFRNHVIAAHARGGYMKSKRTSEKYDLYLFLERFLLGGIDTVRGYEDYEIFPTNAEGEPNLNGGNKVLYGNLEYRIPLADRLTGTIFFDMGQVWDERQSNILRDLSFKKGAGLGIRFDMFGMLARIEWGYGFDREKGKFHFTIGPGF